VAAINEGKVFRFFTKPCPIPVLIEGIDLAIGSRKAMEEAEKANAKALSRNNAMLRQLVVDLTERRASTILRQRSDQFKQPTSPSFQAG